MQNALIMNIALIMLSVTFIFFIIRDYCLRKKHTTSRTVKPEEMFEIRPFDVRGDLFSFNEFRELLKTYSCSSDNGTGYWASIDGLWIDLRSGKQIRVCPDEVRLGKRPEIFFTHIMYYGK